MVTLKTNKDKNIAFECLNASMKECFFPDWEFSTLMGLEKSEVQDIIKNWNNAKTSSPNTLLVIGNCINNLLGYPHGIEGKSWKKYISLSPGELEVYFDRISK